MAVGIVGAGRLGSVLARLIAESGRPVELCNSRGPTSFEHLRPVVCAADALIEQDITILAIPFRRYTELKPELLANRIVIDAMNFDAASDGPLPEIEGGMITSSELVAVHLSAATVIKAFNTLPVELLVAAATPDALIPDRQAIFIAGDDARAKSIVAGLAEDCGYAPVDTGSLKHGGRLQQPGGPLYCCSMSGRIAEKQKRSGWRGLPTP